VIGIVDVPAYVGRVVTAAIVIGIIIVDIARAYGQVNPYAAATTFDFDDIVREALAELWKGLPGRCGIDHGRDAQETGRQQAGYHGG
jgi:hypothetical protein